MDTQSLQSRNAQWRGDRPITAVRHDSSSRLYIIIILRVYLFIIIVILKEVAESSVGGRTLTLAMPKPTATIENKLKADR